jgi:hypothetical protein
VSEAVDDLFRECCTLGRVDGHTVEFLVAHPTMLAALRRRWLMYLVERLDRECRFVVSPRIVFRLGEKGEALDRATPQPRGLGAAVQVERPQEGQGDG